MCICDRLWLRIAHPRDDREDELSPLAAWTRASRRERSDLCSQYICSATEISVSRRSEEETSGMAPLAGGFGKAGKFCS